MAKYDIVSLNYAASGSNRSLLNVEISAHNAFDGIGYYLAVENMLSDANPLSTADVLCCFAISSESNQQQIVAGKPKEVTYVIDKSASKTASKDKNLLHSSATAISPMYDICDVCIKSPLKKSHSANLNLPYTDRDIDIYAPSFTEQPIGFCNIDGRAILLTQPLSTNAMTMFSDLSSQNVTSTNSTYTMRYDTTLADTVLYKTPSELCAECSSYGQYFQMLSDAYPEQEQYLNAMLSAFEPARKFTSLKYNYIVDIEQDNKQLKYDDGNIYGIAVKGKNYLDPTYSQQATLSSLSACRQYVGVLEANGRVYLKYIDNVNADKDSSSQSQPTYQKIEQYKPTVVAQSARHKSNLFSIKLHSTGLDDDSMSHKDQNTKDELQRMKHDIKNVIFDIVKNICPVNTQLFDVYFESE